MEHKGIKYWKTIKNKITFLISFWKYEKNFLLFFFDKVLRAWKHENCIFLRYCFCYFPSLVPRYLFFFNFSLFFLHIRSKKCRRILPARATSFLVFSSEQGTGSLRTQGAMLEGTTQLFHALNVSSAAAPTCYNWKRKRLNVRHLTRDTQDSSVKFSPKIINLN